MKDKNLYIIIKLILLKYYIKEQFYKLNELEL